MNNEEQKKYEKQKADLTKQIGFNFLATTVGAAGMSIANFTGDVIQDPRLRLCVNIILKFPELTAVFAGHYLDEGKKPIDNKTAVSNSVLKTGCTVITDYGGAAVFGSFPYLVYSVLSNSSYYLGRRVELNIKQMPAPKKPPENSNFLMQDLFLQEKSLRESIHGIGLSMQSLKKVKNFFEKKLSDIAQFADSKIEKFSKYLDSYEFKNHIVKDVQKNPYFLSDYKPNKSNSFGFDLRILKDIIPKVPVSSLLNSVQPYQSNFFLDLFKQGGSIRVIPYRPPQNSFSEILKKDRRDKVVYCKDVLKIKNPDELAKILKIPDLRERFEKINNEDNSFVRRNNLNARIERIFNEMNKYRRLGLGHKQKRDELLLKDWFEIDSTEYHHSEMHKCINYLIAQGRRIVPLINLILEDANKEFQSENFRKALNLYKKIKQYMNRIKGITRIPIIQNAETKEKFIDDLIDLLELCCQGQRRLSRPTSNVKNTQNKTDMHAIKVCVEVNSIIKIAIYLPKKYYDSYDRYNVRQCRACKQVISFTAKRIACFQPSNLRINLASYQKGDVLEQLKTGLMRQSGWSKFGDTIISSGQKKLFWLVDDSANLQTGLENLHQILLEKGLTIRPSNVAKFSCDELISHLDSKKEAILRLIGNHLLGKHNNSDSQSFQVHDITMQNLQFYIGNCDEQNRPRKAYGRPPDKRYKKIIKWNDKVIYEAFTSYKPNDVNKVLHQQEGWTYTNSGWWIVSDRQKLYKGLGQVAGYPQVKRTVMRAVVNEQNYLVGIQAVNKLFPIPKIESTSDNNENTSTDTEGGWSNTAKFIGVSAGIGMLSYLIYKLFFGKSTNSGGNQGQNRTQRRRNINPYDDSDDDDDNNNDGFDDPDDTLGNSGTNPNYLYSLQDGYGLNLYIRKKKLKYQNNNVQFRMVGGERYSPTRQNIEGVFLADPYDIGRYSQRFLDDIEIITGRRRGELAAENNRWTQMPRLLIIPILANGHWMSVRVEMNYSRGSADLLWSCPFGGRHYIGVFNRILPDLLRGIQTLIRTYRNDNNFVLNPRALKKRVKTFDQQGMGRNGTNCGPINFSNIEDYTNYRIRNSDFESSEARYRIKRALMSRYMQKMTDIRTMHVRAYRRVIETSSGLSREVRQRINAGQKSIDQERLKRLNWLQGNEFVAQIKRWPRRWQTLFHSSIEQTRLITAKRVGALYTLEEMLKAYEFVRNEMMKSQKSKTKN